MIKPVLRALAENHQDFIVILEKDISNLSEYDRQREIKLFNTTQVKMLYNAISTLTIEFLQDYGIIPYDDSEDALKSAFDTLNRVYHKTIIIIDRYKNTEERIVYRKNLITTIIDKYNVLQVANEIKVIDL